MIDPTPCPASKVEQDNRITAREKTNSPHPEIKVELERLSAQNKLLPPSRGD